MYTVLVGMLVGLAFLVLGMWSLRIANMNGKPGDEFFTDAVKYLVALCALVTVAYSFRLTLNFEAAGRVGDFILFSAMAYWMHKYVAMKGSFWRSFWFAFCITWAALQAFMLVKMCF